MPRWRKLGSGSYNTAYKSEDGTQVLKIQDKSGTEADDYDAPSRSVRLWNELNPNLPPPASLMFDEKLGLGWVCPFVLGRQASDDEMSAALINIFNSTGRVVVDAISSKNFVTTRDGLVVCVDVGMALKMEIAEDSVFGGRQNSITSMNAWNTLREAFTPYFNISRLEYPNTVDTIKALLFINANRPDIFDVSFLTNNQPLVKKLANAYDDTKDKYTRSCLDQLAVEAPISFEHIRESCIKQLDNYIKSRGSINAQGDFNPSLTTKIFRDTMLTARKVTEAKQLIERFKSTTTLEEIKNAINTSKNSTLLQGTITHGMESCIGKCALIIDKAEKYNPNLKLESISPSA